MQEEVVDVTSVEEAPPSDVAAEVVESPAETLLQNPVELPAQEVVPSPPVPVAEVFAETQVAAPVAAPQHTALQGRYKVSKETRKVRTKKGWYQHWTVISPNGKKLKGGVMVQQIGKQQQITTYRDGHHVPGVDIPWLLTQQQ